MTFFVRTSQKLGVGDSPPRSSSVSASLRAGDARLAWRVAALALPLCFACAGRSEPGGRRDPAHTTDAGQDQNNVGDASSSANTREVNTDARSPLLDAAASAVGSLEPTFAPDATGATDVATAAPAVDAGRTASEQTTSATPVLDAASGTSEQAPAAVLDAAGAPSLPAANILDAGAPSSPAVGFLDAGSATSDQTSSSEPVDAGSAWRLDASSAPPALPPLDRVPPLGDLDECVFQNSYGGESSCLIGYTCSGGREPYCSCSYSEEPDLLHCTCSAAERSVSLEVTGVPMLNACDAAMDSLSLVDEHYAELTRVCAPTSDSQEDGTCYLAQECRTVLDAAPGTHVEMITSRLSECAPSTDGERTNCSCDFENIQFNYFTPEPSTCSDALAVCERALDAEASPDSACHSASKEGDHHELFACGPTVLVDDIDVTWVHAASRLACSPDYIDQELDCGCAYADNASLSLEMGHYAGNTLDFSIMFGDGMPGPGYYEVRSQQEAHDMAVQQCHPLGLYELISP